MPTADCITLPRHLHRAILRLLRPAEAAARRLIIVAARELPPVSPPSQAVPGDSAAQRVSSRFADVPVARSKAGERGAKQRGPGRNGNAAQSYPTRIALPLTDPPRRLRRRRRASRAMPRISVPGWTEPAPLPVLPAPDDAIDARRLTLRLAAIARALDDLPREARRFARWRAKGADAAGAQNAESLARTQNDDAAGATRARLRRISPLRHGRPPGQRSPSSRRPAHAVHQILEDVHGLAFDALKAPDTS